MFERFTKDAQTVVVRAQGEARALGHGWIGTEHLLLGVLADETSSVTGALAGLGLDAGRVRTQLLREVGGGVDDDAALRDLGIDVDEVRRRAEERFGPGALDRPVEPTRRRNRRSWRRRACPPAPRGHIPFTPRAKKALELALREAVHLKAGEITVDHLVLGTMRTEGMAARVVTRLGVRPEEVRRAVLDLRRAA